MLTLISSFLRVKKQLDLLDSIETDPHVWTTEEIQTLGSKQDRLTLCRTHGVSRAASQTDYSTYCGRLGTNTQDTMTVRSIVLENRTDTRSSNFDLEINLLHACLTASKLHFQAFIVNVFSLKCSHELWRSLMPTPRANL